MSARQNQFEKSQPLLYITQPKSESIFINMQGTYIGKPEGYVEKVKQNVESEEPLEIESITNVIVDDDPLLEELTIEEEEIKVPSIEEPQTIVDHAVEEASIEEDSESKITYRRKPFKTMNNTEKVYYLLNKPSYIPNLPCTINTEENVYTGIVTDYQNGKVLLTSLVDTENISIDMNKIVDIKFAIR